jgi:hypothetical protein
VFLIPPNPAVPADQQGHAPVRLRYDDITQDGRVQFEAFPAMLGEVAWRTLIDRSPLVVPMREEGIIPILSRMVFEGRPGPFSVDSLFDVECRFAVAREPAPDGGVSRLYLNMWADVHAPHGLTYGPLPDGPPQLAGRLFAEHIFTRPFAEAAQRRVVALPGHDATDASIYIPAPPLELLDLPPGALPLDEALTADEVPQVFGLCHTDSNQHVNSMVYPRILEDAALRAFRRHGKNTVCLMRGLEMLFRKPCFAGETLRLGVRAFSMPDGRCGVVALLLTEEDVALLPHVGTVRPRAVFRAMFEA